METTREAEKMPFNAVKETHQKLVQNPELSDHNKEVLNDFFRKMRTKGTGENTLQGYASRFNTLAELIDFPLDTPEKKDLEKIVASLNSDQLCKDNGEPYSDYQKNHFWKTLRVFYNTFIDVEGTGYNEDLDGRKLLGLHKEKGLEVKVNLDTDIDVDTRPTPKHVRQVAEQASSLRDRALVVFGWATGARIGEIAKTQREHKHPEPIKWRDIKFKEREMEVTLRGKTGERRVPIRTAYSMMKQLQNQENPDLEDPVFMQHKPKLYCPECGSRATSTRSTGYSKRKYSCKADGCDWEGKQDKADKRSKPMSDAGMRKVLKRLVDQSKQKEELPREITHRPHWFWRDARALYWAAKDKNENFLRSFFGWSETSDAPKHYIENMKESVLSGIREDFGEELSDDERKFKDNSLKPWQCTSCGEWVSSLQKYCTGCGKEADEELVEHNLEAEEEVQQLVDEARENDMEDKKFRKIVRGVIEEVNDN